MRNRFDRQLEQLNNELIQMGSMIEHAIEMAVSALVNQDTEKAKEAMAYDVEIDHQERDIESLCMKLLLQQQPVARDLRLISAALKMITDMGGRAESYQCNVADDEACQTMIRDIIKKYGHLDILVNNAGITRDNLVMKMNDEEFDAVYETNLKGVFHTIHHTSRYFLKQKSGRIINISSVSGITGNAGQANYCAAKAGVIGLTKSVARELSSRGITANVVAPGMIETDMTKDLPDTVKENMLHNIPLGRIGKPEEIAAAVAFLASEEAGYITGQVLAVDGGMTM